MIEPAELADAGGKEWFASWYKTQKTNEFDVDKHRMLLFPCYVFDHARGLTLASKRLAYDANFHITEKRPEGVRNDALRLH